GTIMLQEAVQASQPITLEFRPTNGGNPILRNVVLSPTGAYAVADIPVGEYALAIKGAKWLRTVITVNTTNNNAANATIRAGDANDDNSADALDLAILIGAFNTVPDDAGWNPAADFNCDDSADALDLALLIANFNTTGDA